MSTDKPKQTRDVFICHASEDKTMVVRPLAAALMARGITVWLDEADLTLGDSLRRKIDHGLSTSRFAVVVLSHAFFSKEWPQKELDSLVAREDGKEKVILPVWHDIGHSDVVHYSPLLAGKVAVSTSKGIPEVASQVEAAIRKSAIVQPKRSIDVAASVKNRSSVLVNVPETPRHFIPRQELRTLHAAVRKKGSHRIAITGVAGTGKSVLAAALVRSAAVRRNYSDGIVWVEMRKEPNLVARQRQIAESLGNGAPVFSDIEHGKSRLSVLLASAKCIIVLDDVRSIGHLSAFPSVGSDSCVIVTTRYARVAQSFAGSSVFRVNVLTDQEAATLLEKWAGQSLASTDAAISLIRECCNLPAALAMVGAALERRPDRLVTFLDKMKVHDFASIQQQDVDYPYTDLSQLLISSMEDLTGEESRCYSLLASLPEDTPVPDNVVHTYLVRSGLSTTYIAQDMTDALIDRGLVQADASGYAIDGLHHAQLRKLVGLDTMEEFIYLSVRQSRKETALREDPRLMEEMAPYIARHLIGQLIESGSGDRVVDLMIKRYQTTRNRNDNSA